MAGKCTRCHQCIRFAIVSTGDLLIGTVIALIAGRGLAHFSTVSAKRPPNVVHRPDHGQRCVRDRCVRAIMARGFGRPNQVLAPQIAASSAGGESQAHHAAFDAPSYRISLASSKRNACSRSAM